MSAAVSVRGLGKMYHIGLKPPDHTNFREALTGVLRAPFANLRRMRGHLRKEETFWALKDVSFEVKPGEVMGLIGPNGAGKSTLLKILSRITEPTEGEVRLHGRVASLLEVGTGFHPELTGRENVYLNGAILGMKRLEIARKFDEIVAFAEIDKFLDTPVRHYSSGMYVRLAFAVAAHLDPEILIVDEVLAVGDVQFQRKCLGKMRAISADSSRTVLFVSHSMPAVKSLCQRCCLLGGGRLMMQDTANECVDYYMNRALAAEMSAQKALERPSGATPWMKSATLLCDGAPSTLVPNGSHLALEIKFAADAPVRHPRFGLTISTPDGDCLINTNNRFQPSPEFDPPVTQGTIRADLGMVPLTAGPYFISLWLGNATEDTHIAKDVISFELTDRDIWGTGTLPPRRDSHLWWPTKFHFSPASLLHPTPSL